MIMKVFIENEAGSNQKNLYNEKTLEYRKTVEVSRKYPYPYGFVLKTTSGDGDNLDCFVLTNKELKTGLIVECEPIGLMEQFEDGKEDHNILAILKGEDTKVNFEVKEKLKEFVSHVFDHRKGKVVRAGNFHGKEKAEEYIEKCKDENTQKSGGKPTMLYHGSAHKSLQELKPQARKHRAEEGEFLYATPDIAIASIFLVGGVHYGCGRFGDVHYAYIIADRNQFIRNDKGGHIYILSGDSFEVNQGRGLGNDEYVSKEPVKPFKIIEYKSAIDAMMENGVQVYFIDQTTYEKIQKSKDHGHSIYLQLKSENQKRGINIKPLSR